MADLPTEEDKDKGGRPLKFESVKQLRQKIDEYFGNCLPRIDTHTLLRKNTDGSQYEAEEKYMTEKVPFTVNGLARALKTSRETILDYESGKHDDKALDVDESGDRFSDAIKEAKARIAEDVEVRTLSGLTPASAGIFWLKNNDGWKDRQEVDHTTKDQPIPLLAGIAPAKLEVEDDASTADNSAS